MLILDMTTNNLNILRLSKRLFSLITFCLLIPSSALSERDTKPGVVKRRYIHSCPAGTEQIGDGPPKSSIVFCRQILQKGYRLEGDYTAFYRNGNKRSEGTYRLGKKEGAWKVYSKYGDVIETKEYKNGVVKKIPPVVTNPAAQSNNSKPSKDKLFSQDRDVLNQLRVTKSKIPSTRKTNDRFVYGISGQ